MEQPTPGACEISQESRVKRLTEGVAINGSGILHEGQEFSPTIRSATGEFVTGEWPG